ncbi:KEOPS complex subunit Cgi121 [Natrarchaeobaculum aegyptiacum]|uniref:KEOPS complex component n=1 Tax=Natrarchaeobaculum aegyptiacum TaxID=745377 RepID=A0A2Z2HUC5_9EURY|nr:KEOPS complex subunit Cgi121 [Natrarchaeobaculum aegyptiacum]ARS89745.1 KEOPS complex component [Natrarchaeobaculum aegyptiacum]
MEVLACTLEVDDLDAFVARLGEIGDDHGVTIQAFDARYVADRDHLERAVELADRAIDRGENVARDRAVEILLYAAGRRQIDRALEMGVSEGETDAVVVVDADPAASENDDTTDLTDDQRETAALDAIAALEAVSDASSLEDDQPLESGDEAVLCAFFEITAAEREATDATLAALVRERVALLEVEK